MQRIRKNAAECSKMQRNTEKCRQMQRNTEKCSEMQRNAAVLHQILGAVADHWSLGVKAIFHLSLGIIAGHHMPWRQGSTRRCQARAFFALAKSLPTPATLSQGNKTWRTFSDPELTHIHFLRKRMLKFSRQMEVGPRDVW